MASDDEVSESGSPIYRHKPREKPFEHAIGDEEAIRQIGHHIERFVGPVDRVFHEIVSDLVHIDIHFVNPTRERPYYTLVTSGMSDRAMEVPEGAEEFRHAELVLALPSHWQLDESHLKDNRNYWPMEWLKILARMPHEYDTWLYYGHTVPNGDPPEPLANNTQFCCLIIAPPVLFGDKFPQLAVRDDKIINFLAAIPIYQEEMELKLKKGSDELFNRFDRHQINELVDLKRKNVAKKFLGLF